MKTRSGGEVGQVTLSVEAARLRKKLAAEWTITDEAGKFLLDRAMEAWDRLRQAQALLEKEGPTITDRWGQVKLHPATVLEREARAGLLQCFKALNLDLDSLTEDKGNAKKT